MEKNEEQKIWVTISETINLGNYENVKVEAGFSREYSKKENPIKLIETGIDELRDSIKVKAKQIRKKRKD